MGIKGFDELSKKLSEMSNFSEELDGEIASVSFDPFDPSSIEQAIQQVNQAIDAKTTNYQGNAWAVSLAEEMKEKYRAAILEKAASAREGGDNDE